MRTKKEPVKRPFERTKIVCIRLTEQEREELRYIALISGVTYTQLIRDSLLDYLKQIREEIGSAEGSPSNE